MSDEQDKTLSEHDPVDWLDVQLRRMYAEGHTEIPFDQLSRGKRVSALLPNLTLNFTSKWDSDYPTAQAVADGFNRHMRAHQAFYGSSHLVADTSTTARFVQMLYFSPV